MKRSRNHFCFFSLKLSRGWKQARRILCADCKTRMDKIVSLSPLVTAAHNFVWVRKWNKYKISFISPACKVALSMLTLLFVYFVYFYSNCCSCLYAAKYPWVFAILLFEDSFCSCMQNQRTWNRKQWQVFM